MEITRFDVLIVYSSYFADSAASVSEYGVAPFGSRSRCELYNDVYGYLIQACQRKHLSIAFTTSDDIIGAGLCKSYWLYSKNVWTKVLKNGFSKVIFDKVSPTTPQLTAQRNLLFSSPKVKPFNSPTIHKMFIDKLRTYTSLQSFTIPTVALRGTLIKDVDKACMLLKKMIEAHPHAHDFTSAIILKDRFGSGGNLIYKFEKNQLDAISKTVKKHSKQSFILQPFMLFDKGYLHNGERVSADIRLIYLQDNIVQTYVRMAKKGGFLCNEHQGGSLEYLNQCDIPQIVITHAKNIVQRLKHNTSLFALDFVVSNNGNPYLLEGNTGPGLDWNPLIVKNIQKSKEFMRMIALKLVQLSKIAKHVRVKRVRVREVLPTLHIFEPKPIAPFLVA